MSTLAPPSRHSSPSGWQSSVAPAHTRSPPTATPGGCCCSSPRTVPESRPSQLDFTDLDTGLVTAFLTRLETERGNTATTRNARLTAIRSLFRYAALHHPEHAGLIQRVLAIPSKRHAQTMVCFLTPQEVDALLAAPDRTSWYGRRDHALLTLAIQTGLRVSELTSLTRSDLHLRTGACVHCVGKGRKQRVTPLTSQTVAVLTVWLRERAGNPTDPCSPADAADT